MRNTIFELCAETDIVAYEWLRTHPEDFLTVSKLLWHRNLNTTLRIYGSRFDESTGVARMDDWRSSRSKKAAYASVKTILTRTPRDRR
jgi:hypothetical protein